MAGNKAAGRGTKKKRPPSHSRSTNAFLQDRDNQALRLRLAGLDYRSIGAALTPPCQGPAAFKMVQRALARDRAEVAEDVRELEVRRIDRLMARPFTAALDKNVPLPLALKATDSVNVLSARRARLLGLDSAIEIRLTDAVREILNVVRPHVSGPTFQTIAAEIARRGGVGGAGEGTSAGEATPAPADDGE